MKRITAILAAFAMLLTVSCADKQTDSSENAISAPVESIAPDHNVEAAPVEYLGGIYNASDFAHINVQINRQSEKPPISVTEKEMDNIEWEPLMPACRQDAIDRSLSGEEMEERGYFPGFSDISAPSRGFMSSSISCGGGALYLPVLYDDCCILNFLMHGYRIYKSDISKKTTEMIFESNDLDKPLSVDGVTYCGGALWALIQDDAEKTDEEHIARLNEETGEFELVGAIPAKRSARIVNDATASSEDAFIIAVKNGNGESYYEYGTATERLTELGSTDDLRSAVVHRGKLYKCEKDEVGTTAVKADDFELHTDLRGAELVSVTDTMISLTVKGGSETLYCYDLEKNEVYEMNISGMGTPVAGIGKGLLLTQSCVATYIIPELGASFLIVSADNNIMTCRGDDGFNIFVNLGAFRDGNEHNLSSNAESGHKLIALKENE